MNEQKAFWKGFIVASSLAVVFVAGRVSAAPEKEVVDDVSRAIENMTREVDGIGNSLGSIKSDISYVRSYGIPVQVENKSGTRLKTDTK
ncbi:MAG: hypothetical protein KF824_07840 [Fimbriimonadaceae bacterium]|nr:MAG: hypothetical protein KF824_07840 [Fimbriimonadaceae bacterium]